MVQRCYKEGNLNKWVLKTLQKISLPAACLIWLGKLFHSLGVDAQKELSPYIVVWLVVVLSARQYVY